MNVKRITGATQGIAGNRVAPEAIQLWRPGSNPTDYGVHVWNARSVAEVFARYKDRGNPLLIDVEHNGAQMKDGEPAATGGYARLEVRNGAPWLVFDWSDFGREQIATGQRRFLSPEYDVDKETGEILALYRVSLVADPGTHRARMLATANREADMPDLTMIMAAIRAALASEDPAVAKESLMNLLAELDKGGEGAEVAGADDDSESKDEETEVAAAADDEDEDKDDKVAAAAKPTKAAKAAKAAKPKTATVVAAADDAVRIIQNSTRDHLLTTQGDKLEPSIRRWASSQPLEVVKGLLDATPSREGAKVRAAATRGAGKGVAGLSDRELAMCAEKKIDPAKYAETRAAIQARSSNGTGA